MLSVSTKTSYKFKAIEAINNIRISSNVSQLRFQILIAPHYIVSLQTK